MAEKTEKKPAKVARTFYIGTGRRKSAVARVRVTEGKGTILLNDRPLEDYFTEDKDRAAVLGPLKITDQVGRVDVFVNVKGGGITGQAGAVCQGLARAMKTMFSPPAEQKRYQFNLTTIIKTRRDQERDRERAKLAPPPPPPPVRIMNTQPLTMGGQPLIPAPGAPAPVADGVVQPPADPATGMIKKLRDSGYLTRDARMKERKKYGLRGARRGTQFSKR